MTYYVFNAFCAVAFILFVHGELTPPFTVCQRNSTKYSSCLKRALREAWPKFIKGLPEYDFPTLEPFFYGYLHATYDTNEVNGDITMNNFNITGISGARFFGVRTHFLPNDGFQLEVDVVVPLLSAETDMDIKGTVLNTLSVNGKGYVNGTLEKLKGTFYITGHVANDTWFVEHFHLLPVFSKVKVYIRGFFDDDPDLNNLFTNLVNEYSPLLGRVMLPTLSKEWDVKLTNVTNILFSKVSFSKVFP